MSLMEEVAPTGLNTTVWAVLPSRDAHVHGVPLFILVEKDGRLVRMGVTPVERAGEICDRLHEALGGFCERPNLRSLVDAAMPDAPRAMVDNVLAHLTHKRAIHPAGQAVVTAPLEPVAGMARVGQRHVPAVTLSGAAGALAVLMVERRDKGAALVVQWVSPMDFACDATAFARACDGISHQDLIDGLACEAPRLAVAGVAALLQDPQRSLPNHLTIAVLRRQAAELPPNHPVQPALAALLGAVGAIEGDVTQEELERYVEALRRLRGLFVLVANQRQALDDLRFEHLACLASWQAVIDDTVSATIDVVQCVDGGPAASHEQVLRSLERVAGRVLGKAAWSPPARMLAAIAALAIEPYDAFPGEGAIDTRLRECSRLLGVSKAMSSRPYEHGLLASLLGGW